MSAQEIKLSVVVEGLTEEAFVKRVLGPYLELRGISCEPATVTTSRSSEGRRYRGGGNWGKLKANIRQLLADSRPHIRVTTLFDLYRLPPDFPELAEHTKISATAKRVALLEEAMGRAISDQRFLPYLQRHEFEALVLAGLNELKNLLQDRSDQLGWKKLQANIIGLAPEDINDGNATAPSKRLARFIPSYSNERKAKGKLLYGPSVTEAIGLAKLREKCPRFDAWVHKLEMLGTCQ